MVIFGSIPTSVISIKLAIKFEGIMFRYSVSECICEESTGFNYLLIEGLNQP